MLAIVPSVLSQLAAVAEDDAINSNAVMNGIDFWKSILYRLKGEILRFLRAGVGFIRFVNGVI